jgi:hypothetical protein
MCFSLDWLRQICILLIVLGGVFAILKLVIPYVIAKSGFAMGEGFNLIVRCIRIVIYVIIACIVVFICFELIACLLSMTGGLSMPSLKPH